MNRNFIAILFYLVMSHGLAQLNHVPDSSFEILKRPLYNACLIGSVDSFNNTNQYWFTPTDGTPDIYSLLYKNEGFLKLPLVNFYSCRSSAQGLRCIKRYWIEPKTGKSCVALGYSNLRRLGNGPYFHKEYIATPLFPLEKYRKYTVKFSFIPENCPYSNANFSALGFYFSEKKITRYIGNGCYDDTACSDFLPTIIPQVGFQNLTYSCNPDTTIARHWVTLSKSFKASAYYRFLTMGFFDRKLTDFNPCPSYNYLFFDDITVTELPGIVGPDTVCEGSTARYFAYFDSPYYWSADRMGLQKLSNADTFVFSSAVSTWLYCICDNGNQDSIFIQVMPKPQRLGSSPIEFCANQSATINYAPLYDHKFIWSDGPTEANRSIKSPGDYIVSYFNDFGCNYKDTWELHQWDTITAGNLNLSHCFEVSEFEYKWESTEKCFFNQTEILNCKLRWQFPQTGIYSLQNEHGCKSNGNIAVIDLCEPKAYIPNATGNLSANEEFAPVLRYTKKEVLSIYNRWGSKIYESNILKWKPSLRGVYAYKIEAVSLYDEKKLLFRGTIMVLKE